MHTHKELAADAALRVLLVDSMMKALQAPHAERLQAATDIIITVLQTAQDELLASQQETAVALANALNVAQGK